jgi:HemY protein
VRWLVWILLLLAVAIGLSLLVASNEGYVLIVRPPYRLELSLNLLLVLIVLAFISLHLGLRLINYTRRLPGNVRAYKESQRLKKGHAAMLESLHAMVEGRYETAEKSAARALDLGEDAGLSALIAARASHKLKHKSQRDYYLAEAERLAPQATVARLLTQIELLVDDRQYSQALHVIQQLEKIEPKYPPALRLELKVQLRLSNWEQVLVILNLLEKQDAIDSWQLREIRQQAHQQLIKRHAVDLPALSAYWGKIPEEDRLNNRLAMLGAQSFIQAGAANKAAEIVEMSLTKSWDSELAGLLGDCITDNPQKQLQQAEYWLLSHQGDANLLMALGNMCVNMGLWGKAQSYLEASISVKPSAPAHLALAKMLDSQGNSEAANQHYRHSVQLCRSFMASD